ncbi:reverse transcriptase domain-containing protein, partial [Tanacetum coccineum]
EDENAEDVQMADHLRPMEELLRIPILGIEDAIVVPAVLADQFELKPELLDFVSNNSFFGLENDDPHSHIRRFYQITRTLRLNQVPDDVVKLILFPFSLKGAAETWLENEPPNSITSWDDLVSKFLNRFSLILKQESSEKKSQTFNKFSLLHQIDFFYNGLCQSDQDSLNTAAGGNLMIRNIQEALTTIENKAKIRTCRNKPHDSSSGCTSTQIDAITVLTKQVEALEYHFASMRETYDQNQEAAVQLMQNQMELNVITSMDGLTLDGSFTPHSNLLVYQEEEQEPETITEVVEIASSQSTPLNPTGRAGYFIYCIDIVGSLSNKVPIQNDKNSGSPILSPDPVVESISPSLTPFGDIDLLLEETDAFLALDSIPPYIDDGIYDLEGDILFLDGLLSDEIPRDLPPLEVNNDPEGDILFLENLLKDEPLDVEESKIYPLIGESSNTFLMGDEEIKVDPFKEINDPILNPKASKTILDSIDSISDSYDTSYTNPSKLDSEYTLNYDNQIFNIQNEHSEEPETKTIMDEIHSTVQIPPLFEELTSDKSMHDIILHQIRHGMVNSSHLSFYLGLLFLEDNFESLSSDSFELGDQNVVFDPGIFFINGVFSFTRKTPHLLSDNFLIDKCNIQARDSNKNKRFSGGNPCSLSLSIFLVV